MADAPPSLAAIQPTSDKTTPAGRVDLRPLTTSALIDRCFTLYRAHFAGFLLLALLCQIAPLASQVLITVTGIAPTLADLLDNPYGCWSRVGVMLMIMFIA